MGSDLDFRFCLDLFYLPVSESNCIGGVDFIVGLKGLNVVYYEGISGYFYISRFCVYKAILEEL